jgi:two-component system, chemotaxis family, response regulator Rcp1
MILPPNKTVRVADILLVEDNDDDVILTRECFRAAKIIGNLHRVENGEECMAFLRHQRPFENSSPIDLILLDLNMPVMDGREVLIAINADEALNHVPIIVLTTSAAEGDILNMYKLRCNSYIVKPVKFEHFIQVIQMLSDYWLALVALPSNSSVALVKLGDKESKCGSHALTP